MGQRGSNILTTTVSALVNGEVHKWSFFSKASSMFMKPSLAIWYHVKAEQR